MKNKITKKSDKNQELFPLFSIQNKRVELSFTGEQVSSDGGALLLKEVEKQTGIIESLCDCIGDVRDQRYITHDLYSLISQRVYQIACGYEDGNDCDSLKDDAIFKMCCDKLPESDPSLASQPTMSRFENSVRWSDLYRIAECFGMSFINSYDSEPEVIIIDCDDTNNNAYGDQQLILFNNYYGEYCYMPLHIYEGLSGKLITTILKPGRRSKGVNIYAILKRLVLFIRRYWKDTKIIIRGDGHFCSPDFMAWADGFDRINFITGLAGNKKLKELAETTINSAKKSYEVTKLPVKMYHSFPYKAGSWEQAQRVIVKVEVCELGTNIRYIVTDLTEYRTKQLYEIGYCARGTAELYIKEHKLYLKSDRTSCNKFTANQLRLFLHSAAYVLIYTLQKEVLKGTQYYNSTMKTIQLKLIKVAAYVKEKKTKVKIEFPRACPAEEVLSKGFGIFQELRC